MTKEFEDQLMKRMFGKNPDSVYTTQRVMVETGKKIATVSQALNNLYNLRKVAKREIKGSFGRPRIVYFLRKWVRKEYV